MEELAACIWQIPEQEVPEKSSPPCASPVLLVPKT